MARSVDAWKQPDLPEAAEHLENVEEHDDETEEKRCFICFELESTARKKLYFVPCAHGACEPCVQSLRREAVCKAVKGVLCPYCRQAIENYATTMPARQLNKKKLEDSFPVHLKSTRFFLKAERGCPKGRPKVPAPFGWQGVTSIGGLNDYSPPPNVTGSDGPGLRPNRSEENLLDNFQGLPIKPTDNLLAMAETVSGSKQLHFNLRNLTGKKQKQLLKQLLEAVIPHARRLATHHCGNYTLQRLLGFACQHRAEQVHGECAYSALVRSICKDQSLAEISCHEKGTFVIQKMVDCLSGSVELKLVMNSIEGKVGLMANNSNACFSLERIVEICIVSVSRPEGRQPYVSAQEASRYLSRIAMELCVTRDFSFKASQASNYATPSMLIECLRWSATEARTHALLLSLAKRADEFSALGKWGRRFLQGLMSLDVPEVAEAIVDSFVRDSEKLRVGHIASLAIDGKDLFYSCTAAPCLADVYREKIVRDFMLKAQEDNHFLKNPHALQGLCFALSLLPQAAMHENVEILRALGSWSPSLLQTLKGMQAEYCLSQPVNAASASVPLSTSNQSANGLHPIMPPDGVTDSHQAPSVSAENFPPLHQGPYAQPATDASATGATGARATPSETPKKNKTSNTASAQKSTKKGKGSNRNSAGNGSGAEGFSKGSVRRKLKMEMSANDGTESVVLEEKLSSEQSSPAVLSVATSHTSSCLEDEGIESGSKSPGESPFDFSRLGTSSLSAAPAVQPAPSPPPPQRIPLPVTCAVCHVEPASMILLQCRHLSSCKGCATGLKFCPLCSSLVVESLEVTSVSGCTSTEKTGHMKPEDWSGPALVQEAPTYGEEPRRISSHAQLQNGLHMQKSSIPMTSSQPVPFLGHAPNLGPSAMGSFGGLGMAVDGAVFPAGLPNGTISNPGVFATSNIGGIGSLNMQPPLPTNFQVMHQNGQQVQGANFIGLSGHFREVHMSQLAQLAAVDRFPDVNLSFLNANQGEYGASFQQPKQMMAPMDVANLIHAGTFASSSAQQNAVLRPAPYLPPGLF